MATSPVPDYYTSLNCPSLAQGLKNLDDLSSYASLESNTLDPDSRNLLIDFSHDQAWGAFNVNIDDWKALLDAPRPPELKTRWINIWAPHMQEELIKTLTRKYHFTPRLGGLMSQSPAVPWSGTDPRPNEKCSHVP